MITKELEKKLKIRENTCIHCQTLELAKQVLDIFHKIGLKWRSGECYTLGHNWNAFKENTLYYPFEGGFSALGFANLIGYKIISAEKFIDLHTEEFNLENYEPKGDLIGVPKEIISRMLDCQVEQGNPRDVSVFEKDMTAAENKKGFVWRGTKEDYDFWAKVIVEKNFDLFFERYSKKDNQEENQEFKVGDKVYDIILGKIGIVKRILNDISAFPIEVYYEDYRKVLYAHEGKFSSKNKYPILLHYRDDYDYSVIDFNNLPKRQDKRWRAEKGGIYYFIKRDDYNSELDRVCETKDYYSYISNEQYKIGNYFKTREQAQEIVDQMNTYFQKIVKI